MLGIDKYVGIVREGVPKMRERNRSLATPGVLSKGKKIRVVEFLVKIIHVNTQSTWDEKEVK